MAIDHRGCAIPQLDSIWGFGEVGWVSFVWDDLLSDDELIVSSELIVSNDFTVESEKVFENFTFDKKSYSNVFAYLITNNDVAGDSVLKRTITHKLTFSGGAVISRSVHVLVGNI